MGTNQCMRDSGADEADGPLQARRRSLLAWPTTRWAATETLLNACQWALLGGCLGHEHAKAVGHIQRNLAHRGNPPPPLPRRQLAHPTAVPSGPVQGFGWAIAKCLAEAGAEISLGVWVPALNIFETSLRRGKFDESRRLSNGALMEFAHIYPMDAVFDTPEDVPADVSWAPGRSPCVTCTAVLPLCGTVPPQHWRRAGLPPSACFSRCSTAPRRVPADARCPPPPCRSQRTSATPATRAGPSASAPPRCAQRCCVCEAACRLHSGRPGCCSVLPPACGCPPSLRRWRPTGATLTSWCTRWPTGPRCRSRCWRRAAAATWPPCQPPPTPTSPCCRWGGSGGGAGGRERGVGHRVQRG